MTALNLRLPLTAALLLACVACGAAAQVPGLRQGAVSRAGSVSVPTPEAFAGASNQGDAANASAYRRGQDVAYRLYDLEGKGQPVLLVHGWDGKATEMAYLGAGLRTRGFAPYSIDLRPSDAAVADTARSMGKAIDEVLGKEGKTRLSLVCHSMGGLDARYYLGMMWGARRIEKVVTIASPHHGTVIAEFAHGEAKVDLLPESDLIRLLDSLGPPPVPVTSILSWTDQTVVPQNSAVLAGATNLHHWGMTHTGILRNAKVLEQVVAALGAAQ